MNHLPGYLLLASLLSLSGQSVADPRRDQPIYDEGLKLVSFADMFYPPIAQDARIQGAVVISLKLNGDGTVASASALSGARVLVGPSLENATKWRFQPNAERAAIIVYEFKLEGACQRANTVSAVTHFNFVSVTSCSLPALPDRIR